MMMASICGLGQVVPERVMAQLQAARAVECVVGFEYLAYLDPEAGEGQAALYQALQTTTRL